MSWPLPNSENCIVIIDVPFLWLFFQKMNDSGWNLISS